MDIEFCECGGAMIPTREGMKCRACGNAVSRTAEAKIVTRAGKQEVLIFENNDPDLPKTEKQCEECGNNEAFFWLIQTRASDEPPTQFFRCTKCRRVWREYK